MGPLWECEVQTIRTARSASSSCCLVNVPVACSRAQLGGRHGAYTLQLMLLFDVFEPLCYFLHVGAVAWKVRGWPVLGVRRGACVHPIFGPMKYLVEVLALILVRHRPHVPELLQERTQEEGFTQLLISMQAWSAF